MSEKPRDKIQTAFRLAPDKLRDFKIILLKRDEKAQDLIEAFILNYIEQYKDLL